MNKVILIGRLVKDLEIKHTQSGTAVTSFSLAVDRKVKKDDARTTDFFEVECWDKTAEFAGKYFRKGNKIVISGRLQQRRWQDNEGDNRSTVRVVAEEVEFGGTKGDGDSYQSSEVTSPTAKPKVVEFTEISGDDEELPFYGEKG